MFVFFSNADFAYKPFPAEKVISKWYRKAVNYNESLPTSSGKDTSLVGSLALANTFPKGTELLTKTYQDGNRTRKVATGLTKIRYNPDGSAYVAQLIGNPQANMDSRFKGATKSLRKHLLNNNNIRPYRDIEIIPSVTPDNPNRLVKLYNRELGIDEYNMTNKIRLQKIDDISR